MSTNGTSITNIKDLIDALQKAETGDLELIRDGERLEVVVNPQERPEGDPGAIVLQDRPLNWVPSQTATRHPGRHLLLLEPGKVVPHVWQHRSMTPQPRLPNGTSVSITRKTGEPTSIHVKRGDKEWKLKENELHELPTSVVRWE